MRQYSDIPFAREVARFIDADKALENLLQEQGMRLEDILWYAPLFEVRYKSIAAVILKSGVRQILELASGLSLRGLAMTRNPEINYIETDLADLTEEKRALVLSLGEQYHPENRKNYHLATANALDLTQIRAAMRPFSPHQPIAIITEGLIQYLSKEELETLTRNIQSLLLDYGGFWITPDFSFREDVKNISERQKQFRQAVADATGRGMYESAFDNPEHMQAFFNHLGLSLQSLNQVEEASEAVSVAALDETSRATWDKAGPRLKLWVLKPM